MSNPKTQTLSLQSQTPNPEPHTLDAKPPNPKTLKPKTPNPETPKFRVVYTKTLSPNY